MPLLRRKFIFCLGWDQDLIERVFYYDVVEGEAPPPIPFSTFAEAVQEMEIRHQAGVSHVCGCCASCFWKAIEEAKRESMQYTPQTFSVLLLWNQSSLTMC